MKNMLPYLLSLLFVLFIFGIHMSKNSDSMLNEKNNIISNGFLTSQIKYHKELAPFARRPLTTFLIETTARALNLSLGKAFVGVNFFLLFLSGILLFIFSQRLTNTFRFSIINIVVYFLSFSVLFAFFPPIFTYDEPLQYCLIFASLICFVRQQWIGYVLFFTLALITRESSIFLILGLALFLPGTNISNRRSFSVKHLQRFLVISLPVLLYVIFLILFLWKNTLWDATKTELMGRLSCFVENFKNQQNAVETVTSIFLTLGPFLYFLTIYIKNNVLTSFEKKFINAFMFTCVVNTVVVVSATFAREARLFTLPLFFLWPLIGHLFYKEIRLLCSVRLYHQCFKEWRYAMMLLFLTFMNYLISFKVYVPNFESHDNYFNEYLFLLLLVMSSHFLLRDFVERNPDSKKYILRW